MEKIIKSSAVETSHQDKYPENDCRQDAARTWQQKFIEFEILVNQRNSFITTEYYPIANMLFKHMNN
ncbi:hypothetical protein [Calothrix sp. PCC 6303]|uniref:hypothetical protein n=1 Tax=Calothrix sp. PCC 6303 TaxID=1170562 RepID=UPI0002A01EF1|nr:hypothetical protein [Calothrix sp. PCC 6303]AFY99238.1 hypothetical protein Cal6303_0130 [Calothrix sp. PCC 6303]